MTARLAPTSVTGRLLDEVAGAWRAVITATEAGLAAGTGSLAPYARRLVDDGDTLRPGQPLAELIGDAGALAAAEDQLLGHLGVACGVASRAADVLAAAPPDLRVVCGGWKKLPAAMKDAIRDGLAAAGVGPRLVDGDFVYVGKNAVRCLGGVEPAARRAHDLGHGPVAIQVTTPADAVSAARAGGSIVMIDTGDAADVAAADALLRSLDLRAGVTIAFGGGAGPDDLPRLAAAGAQIVDVGRAILERPLLDLRLEILERV